VDCYRRRCLYCNHNLAPPVWCVIDIRDGTPRCHVLAALVGQQLWSGVNGVGSSIQFQGDETDANTLPRL
jgi:hypothetical protein